MLSFSFFPSVPHPQLFLLPFSALSFHWSLAAFWCTPKTPDILKIPQLHSNNSLQNADIIWAVYFLQKPWRFHYKRKTPVEKPHLPRHCPFKKLKLKRKCVMRTIASIHHKVNPKDSDISTRTVSIFSHLIQKLNIGEFVHKIVVFKGSCKSNENRNNSGNSSIFRIEMMIPVLSWKGIENLKFHICNYSVPSLTHIDLLVS